MDVQIKIVDSIKNNEPPIYLPFVDKVLLIQAPRSIVKAQAMRPAGIDNARIALTINSK